MSPVRTKTSGEFVKTKIAGLVALSACTVAPSLYAANIIDAKRGFADTGANYNDLQATNAGWYYNWGTAPSSIGNYNANFYSMIWGSGQSSDTTINYALSVTSTYLLGFNEPERTDQANLTVAAATSIWDRVYADKVAYNSAHGTTIKLISPAVSDTGAGEAWLSSFMATEGSKVDAVAFHWYDDDTTNGAQAAADFESKVQYYHNTYNKPVFITEFADHDWGGTLGTAAMIAANTQMINIVTPWLESQSYVAGYSWYNWFNDSALFNSTGATLTPSSLGYSYAGAIGAGTTTDLVGQDIGEHVADLTGGTLTMSGTGGTVRYIDALSGTSAITGGVNWGLNASTNWVRIQTAATLQKTGSNTITIAAPVSNDGTLQVVGGVLSLGSAVSGTGSLYISSTGDSTGSTARFELTGNINIPQPITFAQRADAGGSDGIRNVSGNNTLSGPMTITVGGNQARIRSDAGLLTLAGNISTNATSPRNLYLQGNGNGTVSGAISDNASNVAGKINLNKQDAGTWTLTGANTYTGATNITGGTLRLDQVSSTTVSALAVASYTFDSVNGTTVTNTGTGGIGVNGTLTGGATIVPGGRFGNALSVAGSGYLNVNNFVAVMTNTGNWTVSAWVKTATPGSTILSKSTSGAWSQRKQRLLSRRWRRRRHRRTSQCHTQRRRLLPIHYFHRFRHRQQLASRHLRRHRRQLRDLRRRRRSVPRRWLQRLHHLRPRQQRAHRSHRRHNRRGWLRQFQRSPRQRAGLQTGPHRPASCLALSRHQCRPSANEHNRHHQLWRHARRQQHCSADCWSLGRCGIRHHFGQRTTHR